VVIHLKVYLGRNNGVSLNICHFETWLRVEIE
jgi:hypothetical protein